MNEADLRNMMYTAYIHRDMPFAIRYPRGRGVLQAWQLPFEEIPIGKARKLTVGERVAVLSIGPLGNQVQKALHILEKEGIRPSHIDMRYLAPLDKDLLKDIAENHNVIITVEDGIQQGGLFSAVSEYFSENSYPHPIFPVAVDGHFVEHGDMESLYRELHFDTESLAEKVRSVWSNLNK